MEIESINSAREQEKALIGAILRRPQDFEKAREIIGDETRFSWDCYGDAWKAMTTLHKSGMAIDVFTVCDQLSRDGKLSDWVQHDAASIVGDMALTEVRQSGTPSGLVSYAENVADYAANREIMRVLQQGAAWASNGRKSGDIMADLEKLFIRLNQISGRKAATSTKTLRQAIDMAHESTIAASKGENRPVMTGFASLDRWTGGLSAPDLFIIAGRPGMGKTAWMTTVADNVNAQGKRVMAFALEMAADQIARRMIAMHSGVDYVKQKTGKMSYEEWQEYYKAVEKLGDRDGFYINDLPAISPAQMRAELRRVGKVDLVLVDYLQLASADGRYDNRVLEIGDISRGLKQIAKDFDVPVIAAAQLSRAVEQRADKEPQLSDLRESGSIEQDADIVGFIHRKDMATPEAALLIKKHRNGQMGAVPMEYKASQTRYIEVTQKTVSFEGKK